MLPVIFRFGPVVLYSFGLMLFLGFLSSLFIVWKKTREEYYEEEEVFDVLVSSGLWALLGARALYILINFSSFGWDGVAWFNIFGKPGFALFGAMIAGGLGIFFQTKKRKWDFFEFTDLLVIGLSLLMTFGWLGAFLNGSGFGLPTESIVGVRFVGMFDKRHPVQLYSLILYLLLFLYLLWVEGKYRTFEWYRAGKSGVRSGFLVFNYMLFSGLIGIVSSVFSPATFHVLDVSLDAWLWLILVIWGIVGLYMRSGRNFSKDMESIVGKKSKKKVRLEKREMGRRRERITNIGDDIL